MQGRMAVGGRGVPQRDWNVAFVHDYLTQFGGAERVLVALHELFPTSTVHTSLVDYEALPEALHAWDIQECMPKMLQGARKHHQFLLPLYHAAFSRLALDAAKADVVIADSSAWAHHVGVGDETVLICYCHSPARFLYGDQNYLSPARLPIGVRSITPVLFSPLRRSDRKASQRVDRYVANSRTVAQRIRRVYGRQVTVVYPPVDVERFLRGGNETPPEDWYLVVSRLVPHKRIDLAVETCTKFGIPLKVIGTGRAMERLQRIAGPTIEFLGYCEDEVVADHVRRCKAFILPAAEDFGITAVEAQAAGRPVIAFGAGGALESVIPWETGVFFSQQNVETLHAAIDAFERRSWDPRLARENAARFDRARFQQEMLMEIDAAIAAKRASHILAAIPEPAPQPELLSSTGAFVGSLGA